MSSNPSPGGEQESWFERWSQRTGPATRLTLYATIGGTALAWLLGLSQALSNCPLFTIQHLELYRLLVSWIIQGSLLGFVFFILSFGQAGPKSEQSLGSLPTLYLISIVSVLSSIGHALLCELLSIGYKSSLLNCSTGAWPLLLALISIDCAKAPEEERRLLCFPVKNKVYPWILALAFTVFSGFTFDVLLGAVLGHAYVFDYLSFAKLHPSTSASWEAGWAASIAQLQGFVAASSARPEGVSGATQQAAGWSRDNREPVSSSNGNGTAMLGGAGRPSIAGPSGQPAATFPGGGRSLSAGPQANSVPSGATAPHGGSAREKRAAAAAAAAARMASEASATTAATATATAPGTVSSHAPLAVPEEELSLLEAMGYSRSEAAHALQAADGDVEAAMASLEETA